MKLIRFIWNIIRITVFFMVTGQWRLFLWKVLDSLPQVWAALTQGDEDQADDAVYTDRMKQCSECPVFDERLKTCGNPWDKGKTWEDPDTGHRVPMGCFCHMEYKARLKNAACWLNEETDYAHGWKTGD